MCIDRDMRQVLRLHHHHHHHHHTHTLLLSSSHTHNNTTTTTEGGGGEERVGRRGQERAWVLGACAAHHRRRCLFASHSREKGRRGRSANFPNPLPYAVSALGKLDLLLRALRLPVRGVALHSGYLFIRQSWWLQSFLVLSSHFFGVWVVWGVQDYWIFLGDVDSARIQRLLLYSGYTRCVSPRSFSPLAAQSSLGAAHYFHGLLFLTVTCWCFFA